MIYHSSVITAASSKYLHPHVFFKLMQQILEKISRIYYKQKMLYSEGQAMSVEVETEVEDPSNLKNNSVAFSTYTA